MLSPLRPSIRPPSPVLTLPIMRGTSACPFADVGRMSADIHALHNSAQIIRPPHPSSLCAGAGRHPRRVQPAWHGASRRGAAPAGARSVGGADGHGTLRQGLHPVSGSGWRQEGASSRCVSARRRGQEGVGVGVGGWWAPAPLARRVSSVGFQACEPFRPCRRCLPSTPFDSPRSPFFGPWLLPAPLRQRCLPRAPSVLTPPPCFF